MRSFASSRVWNRSLLVAAGATALAACAPGDLPAGEDTGNLGDDVRVCASGSTLQGIDVSVHNGHVDWAKVKASGRAFAFARVSDGAHHPDTEFKANWEGIKAQGMVRGVYQFFRASQDPIAQADYLLSQVGTLEQGDLPPVIDVEVDDGVSGAAVVKATKAWIDHVKARTGVTPIIYTGPGFWNALSNTSQFAGEPLWVANYTKLCASMPTTWKQWAFWQSSESGSVPGVSGGIDVDVFNGTLADLEALAAGSPGQEPQCTVDADCNQGAPGSGLVCSNSGSSAGRCIQGCHADSDCPAGDTCDQQASPWKCVATAPSGCTKDADCNGGAAGTGRVCSNAGACIDGCHSAADCPAGDTCDETQSPWQCAAPPPPPSCPVLTFPSGIKIQTVTDATMTASYTGHLAAGQSAPKCFLDVTNLHNPDTGETYDLTVHVAANFQLEELVGTEVSQGWGNFVLLSPAAVESLEEFRMSVGGPVTVNSGFRGPKHQESVCNSLCGDPLGCPGTCANNSRHMWGDAFDLPTSFYSSYYTNLACQDGFKFTYLESGTHLHVDQNPAYATCVQQ